MKSLSTFLASTSLAIMSAGFLVSGAVPVRAQAVEATIVTADQCSPLTDDNYQLCCMAQNRADVLTTAQIAACPPLSTALISENPFSTTSTEGPRSGDDGGAGGGTGGGGGGPGGGNGGGGGGDNGGGGQDNGGGGQDHGKGNQDHGKGNQDHGKRNLD
ncbi:hypothetical protein ATB98_04015 [Sinorhizobium saheli]|uniref:Glycine-rich protein n=1 Tax=Sinorhizobium saheli TaxID=36856 RepID=A0A178YEX5_SINSA|nr:hypothetical protein ATB98_04015 [Sinorhizobium saheli]